MIKAIQNPLARMPLRIMLHDHTPSLDQWLHLLQKRLQTLTYYISVARYDLKNPKTAPETSNHHQCKSICTEPQYHLNWSQAKILKISNSRFSSLYSQKNMSIIRYNYAPLYPNTGTGIFRIGHPISQVALLVSWTILS